MGAFTKGLGASIAIAAGYIPIAFSFGLAALNAGLSPTATLLISILIFAGASQFVLISLLASGVGLPIALPTVLLMNARHLFYGPAVCSRLDPIRAPSALLSFGLTDEVFAASMARFDELDLNERESWYIGMQTGAYLSWVVGTALGITLGHNLEHPPLWVSEALFFVLPALFFVLLLEMDIRNLLRTLIATALITAVLLCVLPSHLALALAILGGTLFHALGAHT
ncbi:AzlC family ABC transporter permease [Alcaligenaceae bacterium CGII-47]|nr:AzlC family ABC transporter permease [Alcaligenaceae bacterium CGII-47]